MTASCAGNDGEAMVAASGGTPITPSPEYTYQWYDPLLDPLGTADTETGLVEGIYVVEVTDGNGCMESIAITVSREAVPAIVVDDSTMVSCFGVCDGDITTTVTGINHLHCLGLDQVLFPVLQRIYLVCAQEYIFLLQQIILQGVRH